MRKLRFTEVRWPSPRLQRQWVPQVTSSKLLKILVRQEFPAQLKSNHCHWIEGLDDLSKAALFWTLQLAQLALVAASHAFLHSTYRGFNSYLCVLINVCTRHELMNAAPVSLLFSAIFSDLGTVPALSRYALNVSWLDKWMDRWVGAFSLITCNRARAGNS